LSLGSSLSILQLTKRGGGQKGDQWPKGELRPQAQKRGLGGGEREKRFQITGRGEQKRKKNKQKLGTFGKGTGRGPGAEVEKKKNFKKKAKILPGGHLQEKTVGNSGEKREGN